MSRNARDIPFVPILGKWDIDYLLTLVQKDRLEQGDPYLTLPNRGSMCRNNIRAQLQIWLDHLDPRFGRSGEATKA